MELIDSSSNENSVCPLKIHFRLENDLLLHLRNIDNRSHHIRHIPRDSGPLNSKFISAFIAKVSKINKNNKSMNVFHRNHSVH